VSRNKSDRKRFLEFCLRTGQCLRMAWMVIEAVPKDFDPTIKVSLGVVGELLSHAINFALLLLRQPMICPNRWSNKYLTENNLKGNEASSVRETMLSNGWCPSDIARAMNNLGSLQLLHLVGKMDRSLPQRDHKQCNDVNCAAYQIKKDYEVRYVQPTCSCKLVSINNRAIIGVLGREEKIPLLRIVGGIEGLEIEVVPSSNNIIVGSDFRSLAVGESKWDAKREIFCR
jgi:hypothetical protein